MFKYRVVKERYAFYIELEHFGRWDKLSQPYHSLEEAKDAIDYLKGQDRERHSSKVVYED